SYGAGETDGPPDVGWPGRPAVAECGSILGATLVDVAAAEANAERARERGLDPSCVRARMGGTVTKRDSCGLDRIATDPRCHRGGEHHREPRGRPVEQVVESRRRPAELEVALTAMADHRVERVRRAIDERARRAGERASEQRRDDRVAGVLRDGLDRRTGE